MDLERVVKGEDSVVLGVHSSGRGRASGVPIDVHWGIAFHVYGSKISRVDIHGDWAKALEAVGLRESAPASRGRAARRSTPSR
jgi:hypothetical protein